MHGALYIKSLVQPQHTMPCYSKIKKRGIENGQIQKMGCIPAISCDVHSSQYSNASPRGGVSSKTRPVT